MKRSACNSRSPNIRRGLLAGAVGGLAGGWIMATVERLLRRGSDVQETGGQAQAFVSQGEDRAVSAQVAVLASRQVLGRPLTDPQLRAAASTVRWTVSAALGGLYGAIAQVEPRITAGHGGPFGAAVWAINEATLPLLRTPQAPLAIPAEVRLEGGLSHIAYGLVLETTRRLLLHF